MKRIITVIVLALMMIWGVGVQKVDAGYMDPVTFFVVDDDTGSNDDSVTLNFSYISWGSAQLQYSLDNSAWTDVMSEVTVAASNWQQVWLRLDLASGYDTDGDVTLLGLEQNSGLYNAVQVVWGMVPGQNSYLNVSIGVANDDDNIGAVPIPGAVWLLGSGLLGLVGIRRRKG